MPNEISADKIAQLLTVKPKGGIISGGNAFLDEWGQNSPIHLRRLMHHPSLNGNNDYVRFDDEQLPCTFPHCKLNVRLRVEGVPYCTSHAAFGLIYIIKRLESRLINVSNARE